MAFDLVTIGNACIDLFVPPHAPPPPSGITLVPSLHLTPGGNGFNTAVTAARLGLRTALAGVLGDDVLGRHLRDYARGEGVDTSLLELRPGRASPLTLVFNDPAGERSFVHHPGTNADYALAGAAIETPCRIFHFAAPELLGGFWPEGALAAARRLRAAGRTLTLDTFAVAGEEPRAAIAHRHRPLLELMDVVLPNEDEARLIADRDDLGEAAAAFHALGVKVVAIKRGEKGALLSSGGELTDIPTAAVAAVDTCGAGDNFAGGFLAGMLRGLDTRRAAALGCALGTLSVAHQGSLTGTADRGRLQAVLGAFDF